MVGCNNSKPGESPSGSDLDAYVEAFESAQAAMGHADVTAFAPPEDHPEYLNVVCELVRVDLEHRWERGEAKPIEEYEREFPALFRDRERLGAIAFEEYRLRRQAGENPSPGEYH